MWSPLIQANSQRRKAAPVVERSRRPAAIRKALMKLDSPGLARSNAAFKLPVLPIVRENNSDNANEPIGFRQMRSFHASGVVVQSPWLFSSLADFWPGSTVLRFLSRATAPIPAPGARRRNTDLGPPPLHFCRRRASFPSPGKLKGAAPKSGPLPVEMDVRDQMPAPASSILARLRRQADSVQLRG